MYKTIRFQNSEYPAFQGEGFAAKFAFPFAKEVLKYCQQGFDVGCNRKEWALPGAIPIDPNLKNHTITLDNNNFFVHKDYHAMNLPDDIVPHYIFSSHMLEHYPGSWVEVLEYWKTKLPENGILFLYLPHYSQIYWRSFNNKKHVHNFTPNIIRDYLDNGGWKDIFVSEGYDLNHSFYAIAKKA